LSKAARLRHAKAEFILRKNALRAFFLKINSIRASVAGTSGHWYQQAGTL